VADKVKSFPIPLDKRFRNQTEENNSFILLLSGVGIFFSQLFFLLVAKKNRRSPPPFHPKLKSRPSLQGVDEKPWLFSCISPPKVGRLTGSTLSVYAKTTSLSVFSDSISFRIDAD
jgi:hypothetical protein